MWDRFAPSCPLLVAAGRAQTALRFFTTSRVHSMRVRGKLVGVVTRLPRLARPGLFSSSCSTRIIASGWDVVGSRNFGRFIYEGDSAPPGSGRIEQLFCAYFAAHRQASVELSLGGSSDHAPFADASIAIGGSSRAPTSGSRPLWHACSAELQAGRTTPATTTPATRVAKVDMRVLGQMADAAAFVAMRLAG